MKNAFFGLITLLMLLGVATYGAIQLYHLPPNHARWTAQIDNALLKVADDVAQRNQYWVYNKDLSHLSDKDFHWSVKEIKTQEYTQGMYALIDSLFRQKSVNKQQIIDTISTYCKQLPTVDVTKLTKEDSIYFVNSGYLLDTTFKHLQLSASNITPAQAKLSVALVEYAWSIIFGSKYKELCFSTNFYSPFLKAQAFLQTEMLQPNDTLDLSIHLAARKLNLDFSALIAEKRYRRLPDNWVHYETILNNTGTFQLEGIISPPSCSTCMIKTYPFSRTYTVEACR